MKNTHTRMERERRCTVKKRHPYGKREALYSEKMTPVWKEALYSEKNDTRMERGVVH